jgi:hypothetical protein
VTGLCVYRFDRYLVEQVSAFTGRMEQVYARAAILVSESGGPLLLFLHPGGALVPCGIEVPWEEVRPRPGLPVTKEDRCIRAGDLLLRLTGEGQSLRSGTSGWSVKVMQERLSALRLPERTRALLGRCKYESRLEGRITAAAGRKLDRLVGRLRDGAAGSGSYRDTVGGLAGLGPGSTPTGDDLLLGVCALAWRLASAGLLCRDSLDGFTASLIELPPEATTRTGREMLVHAARGAFFETLFRFVDALGDETAGDGDIARAAGRLERTGGKSGCDMLAGVVALAGAFAQGAQA